MAFEDKGYNNNLQIINGKNSEKIASFNVKIVSSKEDMEKGLMFVKKMPENHGMLFQFSQEQIITMWMKNTFISLDMIFIDKNNQIVTIAHSTTPLSQDIISSGSNSNKVLEINGGLSKKLKIKVGDIVKLS